MNPDDASLFQTRASLLHRLKDSEDQDGWREFFEIYWRLIYSFARRSGLSETDSEDVVQDTMVSVSRQMPGFRYDPARGSFKSWLLVLVKHRIVDRHRRESRWSDHVVPLAEPGTGSQTQLDPADPARPDLDQLWAAEWESHVLTTALARIRSRVSEKQYLMYALHVIQEVPLARVATNLQTSSMSVYLAKHRVGKLLRAELENVRRTVDQP
jgi:RNA polymerase sigma-70 factor (ECF subfamily)